MKSVFYVIIRTLLVIPAKLLFRVRVVGRKNEPKKGEGVYLVCANHQTVLDPVFLCIALRRQQPHFMGKESLFRVPVLGRLVRWLGAYPVSRGRSDVGAIKHTIKLIESGRSVGMFPQGTRCPGMDVRETKVKAGVGMITKLFADRLSGEGITVNEICPGIIETGMTAAVKEKYDRLIADGLVPLGRWGQPEDVAKAVVALCDGTFGYTTGESFILDGGMHIRKL